MEEKLRVIRLLTNRDVLNCLRKISKTESRFTDLADVCPSERLRSLRLAELEKAGLIKKNPLLEGNKVKVFYQLTKEGKGILQGIERLLQ